MPIEQTNSTMTAIKVNENTLRVNKVIAEKVESNTYDVAFLKSQLVAIQAQKDMDNANRDKELAEVNALLELCNEQGIVEKVDPKVENTQVEEPQ